MKGYLKTLPWINTAPIPADLNTDMSTLVEPSFISKKFKFWVKNTSTYHLQEPITKMCSSLGIAFFTYLTCLLLYGSRHNFSLPLHAVATEISASSVNYSRYLQGDILIWLQFHHAFPQLAQHST
jgi:hypothetical protein